MKKIIPALLLVSILTGSLAGAAPSPPDPSVPSDTSAKPAVAPAQDAAGVSDNGYSITVRYWLTLEQQARETEKVLQDLYSQTETEIPNDPARLRAFFSKKLSEKFPGSSFNGVLGTIVLPSKLLAHFNDKFVIDRLEEAGAISVNYFLKQGQFVCSNGTNSVGGLINKANPAQSVFTKVDIAAMKDDAEKILADRSVTANTAEEALINDAYQLLASTNKIRMDIYAGQLVVSSAAQKSALNIATTGYKERHPEEFQPGAQGANKAKNKNIDLELPGSMGKTKKMLLQLVVVAVLFVACALAVKLVWHFVSAGLKKSKKRTKKRRHRSHGSSESGSSSDSAGSLGSHSSSRSRSSSRSHGTPRSRDTSRSDDKDGS